MVQCSHLKYYVNYEKQVTTSYLLTSKRKQGMPFAQIELATMQTLGRNIISMRREFPKVKVVGISSLCLPHVLSSGPLMALTTVV